MPLIHRQRNSHGVLRMFFFLSIFSLSALIVYFTLGKVYGYGGNENLMTKSGDGSRRRLQPRSELYSHYHDHDTHLSSHSHSHSHSNTHSHTNTHSNTHSHINSHSQNMEFSLIVFGWRRKDSLERLMKSLTAAEYFNYNVQLQFNIEFEPSEEVKEFVESVNWPHGTKMIVWRKEKYGLERMVMESWKASKDNEFAFFFEDDIEVHSKYFEFALKALKKKDIVHNSNLVGIALNTPRYDEVSLEHSIWLPEFVIGKESKLFLFQQPCSWGALYFPWKWREFLEYYSKRRLNQFPVPTAEYRKVIPESCVFQWGKSWKKYLMEMMVIEGYVMLYPSLTNQESLSVHHREEGEHTGSISKFDIQVVDYFTVPLVGNEKAKALIDEINKVKVNKLPIVSFHHFPVKSIDDLKKFGRILKLK